MSDITITSTSLPPAFLGAPYEASVGYKGAATAVTAQSISVGNLPHGLALDTVGAAPGSLRISGTPDGAANATPQSGVGVYTFTVSVTDTAGAVTKSLSITLYGAYGDEKLTADFDTPTYRNNQRKLN